ncbi:hypothetical protein [Hoeflea sp.]|uniref:hypothetical protein n=1 Tax=Hoeflea sp. TaxID=1940281 RepID=UPI003B026604
MNEQQSSASGKEADKPARLSLTCFGACIDIEANRTDILEMVRPVLPPNAADGRTGRADRSFFVEQRGDGQLRLTDDRDEVDRVLETDAALLDLQSLLHDTVAQYARGFVFVHAGVVAWNSGAIVIPGRTMSGKTSLVSALVKRGAEYLSDEFAVLTSEGHVLPYQKPLSVRSSDGTATLVPPGTFGKSAGTEAVPVKVIIETRYEPGSDWQPQRLSQGRALMAMLDNTVAVRKVPERSMDYLSKAVRGAIALSGPRGEADQLCQSLMNLLDKQI